MHGELSSTESAIYLLKGLASWHSMRVNWRRPLDCSSNCSASTGRREDLDEDLSLFFLVVPVVSQMHNKMGTLSFTLLMVLRVPQGQPLISGF